MEHLSHAIQTPLTSIVIALSLGVFTLLFTRKAGMVPVGPLLLVGILAGPQVLSIIDPSNLGEMLELTISLGVAIILFEGALALDYSGYRKAGGMIVRLLSVGVVITLVCNALAIYFIFNFSFTFSLFCSSLIVVTGPTVISPLLRRLNVTRRLYNILHWEGVLIDPIGVLLSILCFQIATSQGGLNQAIGQLANQLVIGIGIGLILGYLSVNALNRRWIPEEQVNVFTLTMAILTFGFCNLLAEEAGILGVVVAGMVIGINKKINIEDIKKFKLELTELFLGFLFIVLSANIDLSKMGLFGMQGLAVMFFVLFVTRPLSIFACSLGSNLRLREKLFLSWISPRGIVAASIATIFSLSLNENPNFTQEAWFVEAFTFSVIVVTVVLQGFSSRLVARGLKVSATGQSWVIVGAHDFSKEIALFLLNHKIDVTIIDNNETRVKLMQSKGIETINANSLSHDLFLREGVFNTSHVLALTDNEQLNKLVCNHWLKIVPSENLFRWDTEAAESTQDRKNGIAIWQNIPKPMLVSLELAKKELSTRELSPKEIADLDMPSKEEKELDKTSTDRDVSENTQQTAKQAGKSPLEDWQTPLLLLRDGKATPYTPERNEALAEVDELFVLEKSKASRITSFAPKAWHLFNKNETKDAVFSHMSLCPSQAGVALSADQQKRILDKKNDHTVCIGNELGIISLPIAGLKEITPILILHKQGMDLNAYDKKLVHLLFLLIYPYSKRNSYFTCLSRISQFALDEENVTRLKNTSTKEEAEELISTWEEYSTRPPVAKEKEL